MKFTVSIMEEVIQDRQVMYRKRPDLGFHIVDVPYPSAGLRKAQVIMKQRMGQDYFLWSSALTSRTSAQMLIRRGPKPQPAPRPGTVRRTGTRRSI